MPAKHVSLGIALFVAAATLVFQQTARPLAAPQAARGAAPQAPSATKSADAGLPPLLYLCPDPRHFDVIEDKAGKCPKDGLALVPVRIAIAYSCLNNTAFIQEKPGKCRTDGSDLVKISASLYFGCPGSDKKELNPGKCADGSDRVKRYEPRPHGDHNPRHGGQLFMADDAWHHLEGAYPSAGLFRVYFYDDWTKPLVPKGFVARAVIRDAAGKDIASVPLKAGRISNTMEAQIPNTALPFRTQLKIVFEPGEREKAFDFQFNEYSKDPAPPPAQSTAARPAATPAAAARGTAPASGRGTAPAARGKAPATKPAAAAAAASQKATEAPTPQNLPPPLGVQVEMMGPIILQEDPIPPTAKAILAELVVKSTEVATDLETGVSLGQLWVPALRTKNLALALVNDHLTEVPAQQRTAALNAANQILRAAFAIDNFGDLGDKEKILSVHEVFALGVKNLRAAYDTIR